MKRYILVGMLTALMVSMPIFSCNDTDSMTRMESVPSRGILSSSIDYARNHAVCLFVIGALSSYIYIHSVLESMKPDPYEGPLRQAHALLYEREKEIEELKKAITFLTPLYKILAPKLKGLTLLS